MLFKWMTGGWAVLGFAYLLTVLTVSLGVTLGLIAGVIFAPSALTIKLAIFLGVVAGGLTWAILRGLFVRIHPPEGLRLKREETPELFALIEELRTEIEAPHFHRVLITGEHNAGVVQIPRLGVFGWHCNYLMLGLPLLQGVSVEEFRAILAHEFAHLSGAHGKFGAWLYRLRRTWQQVFEQLERQQQRGSTVLAKFLDWFWPRFNARAFVLSRAQEYEADALAARVVSPQALATGLLRTQVQGRWLEERFWPEIFDRVKVEEAPPAGLFREMGAGLNSLPSVPATAQWLVQAYRFETNNTDTHPCLRDRLKALPGLSAELSAENPPESLPAPATPDAASALLGAHLSVLEAKLHEQWSTAILPNWKERHARVKEIDSELAAATEATAEETAEALWKRAALVLERDDDVGVQPLIERVLAVDATHAAANFVRARYLLSQEDARGVEYLEKALQKDPFATPQGFELLAGYYARNGYPEKIKELEKRLDEHDRLVSLAQGERSTATVNDTLLPPELSTEEKAALAVLAESFPTISGMHVVLKQVTYFPQNPMRLIALTVKVPWWKPVSTAASQKLVENIINKIELPGQFLVFVAEKDLKKLARKVAGVPDSEVYRRQPGKS